MLLLGTIKSQVHKTTQFPAKSVIILQVSKKKKEKEKKERKKESLVKINLKGKNKVHMLMS